MFEQAFVSIHVILLLIFFFLLCYCTFFTSLSNGWTFDDNLAIVNNEDTQTHIPFFPTLLQHDIWGKDITAIDSHRSFRPFLVATFKLLRLNYGLDAPSFRKVSIFFHFITTLLVYQLFTKLQDNIHIAFATACLFATHPIHIESVAAVVNIAEPLSAIFYLLSFLLYFNCILEFKRYNERSLIRTIVIYFVIPLLWMIFVFTSILVKESALSICCTILATLVIQVLDCYLLNIKMKNILLGTIIWIVLPISIVFLYLLLRNVVVTQSMQQVYDLLQGNLNALSISDSYLNDSKLLRKAENPFILLLGKEKYLSNMYLHFRYFYLLLWPIQQSPEYSFDCIPKISNPYDLRFLATIAMYLGIISLGVQGLISLVSKKSPIILHGLIWMIIPFIPASGILRLGTLLAERLLYLPSIGFCLLLASCIFLLISKVFSNLLISKSLYYFIISMICLCYIYRSNEYSKSWKDDRSLFLDSLNVCPNSAKLNLQVTKLFVNEHNVGEAMKHIERVKAIDADFCDVRLQEAYVALLQFNEEVAIQHLVKSLSCEFTSMSAMQLLNSIHENQLKLNQKKFQVLVSQGDSYMNDESSSLLVFGLKKYYEASQLAFSQYDVNSAMLIALKYEGFLNNLISSIDMDESESSIQNSQIIQLYCMLRTWSGKMRYEISTNPTYEAKLKKKYSKSVKKYLMHTLAATSKECIIFDKASFTISSNPALHAINIAEPMISHMHNKDLSKDITSMKYYLIYLDNLIRIIVVKDMERVRGSYVDLNQHQDNLSVWSLMKASIRYSVILGKHYFHQRLFVKASQYFTRSLQYDGASVLESHEVVLGFNLTEWTSVMFRLYSKKIEIDRIGSVSYRLYWLVQAVAGVDEFLFDEISLSRVRRILEHIQNDSSDKFHLILQPKVDIQLKNISKFMDYNSSFNSMTCSSI